MGCNVLWFLHIFFYLKTVILSSVLFINKKKYAAPSTLSAVVALPPCRAGE
jgi:hypothetical protein